MKSTRLVKVFQEAKVDSTERSPETDLLFDDCVTGLLGTQLSAFNTAKKEDILTPNFITTEAFCEEKVEKANLNVKKLFNTRKPTTAQREQKAKEAVSRQEIAGAISELANLAAESGKFVCIDGALYCFNGVIWKWVGSEDNATVILRNTMSSEILEQLTRKQFNELIFKIRTSPGIQERWAAIPKSPNLIACLDGVYDLDTGRCRAARAEDYLFSQNNFYTDEIGCGEGWRFDAFLEKCSNGAPAIQQLILEIIGTVVSGYRPRKFFLFYGEPWTGKSQMADLMALLVGKESMHGIDTPGGLGERFALGSLIGKKLCVCGDAEDAVLSTKAVAIIKQITGGDPVLIEVKHQQPFSSVCEALLVFCSNEKLKFKYDRGLCDRLITVPFYNPMAQGEAVDKYSELLFKERGYIIGRALEALRALRERHFQFTHVEAEGMEYSDNGIQDSQVAITEFAEQVCEFSPDSHTLSRDLYEAYRLFCQQNGYLPIGNSAFFRTFSAHHPELERTNLRSGRGYRGVRILLMDDACTTRADGIIN